MFFHALRLRSEPGYDVAASLFDCYIITVRSLNLP